MGVFFSFRDIDEHPLLRLYSNFYNQVNVQIQNDTIYRIVLLSLMGLIHGTGLNEQAQYDGLLVFSLNHKPDNTVVFLNVLFLMQAISMSVLHISILA
jgi:hypothetical protein